MKIESTLHGMLAGIGKRRKDGSVEFRWLDRPIHNRIVSGGLDYMLTLNGSNTNTLTTTTYPSSYCLSYRRPNSTESQAGLNGPLQYMSIGTDGHATRFTDTALGSQVEGYSETVGITGVVTNNGSYFDTDESERNAIVRNRVTLRSVAVSADTSVREIGFHGKYVGQEVYPLFSRIALDQPYELLSGESLIACYELRVTYGGVGETDVPGALLRNMFDADGNQVTAKMRLCICGANPTLRQWSSNGTMGIPTIGSDGYGSFGGTISGAGRHGMYQIYPPFVYNNYRADYDDNATTLFLMYKRTIDGTDPYKQYGYPLLFKNGTYRGNGTSYGVTNYSTYLYTTISSNPTSSATIKEYVPGSFYRDTEVLLYPSWPYINDEYDDVEAMCYNGLVIRFGHYDDGDPALWVQNPWRKSIRDSYRFTFRYKVSTADTI